MAWQAAMKLTDVQRSCRKGPELAEGMLSICALYAPVWVIRRADWVDSEVGLREIVRVSQCFVFTAMADPSGRWELREELYKR